MATSKMAYVLRLGQIAGNYGALRRERGFYVVLTCSLRGTFDAKGGECAIESI
ncbi:MAG: hypothetical protein GY822_20185 [Deltaproteobacteria bacterium]|nr:hypothetical protein [Deltaproteobacteria bacterium]